MVFAERLFMVEPDFELYEKAWVQLSSGHQLVLETIETALRLADLPPLSWYDVLLELSRVDDGGLRALELEGRLLLPQYGLSRLLDRIEKAGYIVRQVCKEDRRGKVLFITEAGDEIRRRMWPVYKKAIEDSIGGKLTKTEAAKFIQLLTKIRE